MIYSMGIWSIHKVETLGLLLLCICVFNGSMASTPSTAQDVPWDHFHVHTQIQTCCELTFLSLIKLHHPVIKIPLWQ